MKRIVIFASGSGSNAENIISFFSEKPQAQVVAVLTNKSTAKVLERCDRYCPNMAERACMEIECIKP